MFIVLRGSQSISLYMQSIVEFSDWSPLVNTTHAQWHDEVWNTRRNGRWIWHYSWQCVGDLHFHRGKCGYSWHQAWSTQLNNCVRCCAGGWGWGGGGPILLFRIPRYHRVILPPILPLDGYSTGRDIYLHPLRAVQGEMLHLVLE